MAVKPTATNSEPSTNLPDLYEASISELQSGLQAGAFTSVDLIKVYMSSIKVNAPLTDMHRLTLLE